MAVCGSPTSGLAAATAELIVIGAKPASGELVGVNDRGELRFRDPDGGERAVAIEDLVRWAMPVVPKAGDEIVLVDGSRLCLAPSWAKEATLLADGQQFVAKSSIIGEIEIPRAQVRAVLWNLPPDALRRQQMYDRVVAAQSGGDDALLLGSGDVLRGKLTAITEKPSAGGVDGGRTVAFETGTGPVELPVEKVVGIALAGNPIQKSSPKTAEPTVVVGLRDGSLIAAKALTVEGETRALSNATVGKIRGGALADIVFLQGRGGRATYLSDLEPLSYRHEPYLDLAWPYRRDCNVLDGPLFKGGRRFLEGLGMHSASRLTYAVDAKYDRFAASIAVDDAAEGRGSVVFRVFLKGRGEWTEAVASPIVRGGGGRVEVAIPLGDTGQIALAVDYADRGDERDDADWLDARLEQTAPSRPK